MCAFSDQIMIFWAIGFPRPLFVFWGDGCSSDTKYLRSFIDLLPSSIVELAKCLGEQGFFGILCLVSLQRLNISLMLLL